MHDRVLCVCMHVCVVLRVGCLATTYPCTDGPRWGHPKPGTKSQGHGNESKHTCTHTIDNLLYAVENEHSLTLESLIIAHGVFSVMLT